MVCFRRTLAITILLAWFTLVNHAYSGVTPDPFGFSLGIGENEEAELELVLSNGGEAEVGFNIEFELVVEEDDNRGIPRRDEPGEVLRRYRIPYIHTIGLAWDEDREWMWGLDWTERRLYAIDVEDGEIQVNVVMNQGLVGLFYWDGVLYGGGYNDNRLIYLYDTDGRALETWRLPISLRDSHIGGDGEYIYTIAYQRGGGQGDVHVFDMEELEQVAVIDCREGIGIDVWGLVVIPDHHDGYLWLCNPNRMFQYNVDEDWNAELVQEFETVRGQPGHCGLSHDGENLWRGVYGVNDRDWYVIDDGVREFYMLTANPETGIIAGEDAESVTILVETEGYEAGVYNILIEIELFEPEEERDDFEETSIFISAIVSLSSPTADITGTVSEAADGDPVTGAFIELDDYLFGRYSDDEGVYNLNELPLGQYNLTISAPDYLTAAAEIVLGEEGEFELDIELLQAVFMPSRETFFTDLEPGRNRVFGFNVTNEGNGPLTYTVDRRLPGGAEAEPWEVREIENYEALTEDDMLNGVTMADGYFVISGGNSGQQVNMIYVFDTEGNPVREFEQFHESRYGMRDLTWDDTLIWGADEGVLYGFTVGGELVEEIEGDAESYRLLTWDPDRNVFWSADITSNIFATNRNGEVVRTINRPDNRCMYGMAYWSGDPDGYQLYMFARGDTTDLLVNKVNLDNGEAMLAAEMNVEGDTRPGGIEVTTQFDIYSWVLIGIVQSPDRVAVWQLEARKEWFTIEPESGVIAPDESENFQLILDATGFPADVTLEGELVFVHDGVGGETALPVRLEIVEGEVRTSRDLLLRLGWNMVSVNVRPDEEDVEVLMAGLVEAGLLEMMKDGRGHFYLPDRGFNNIPGWFVEQGYQIKMRGAEVLTIEGISVLRNHPIELEDGWQLVSYYPNFPIEATVALSGISEHLIIAKDGYGNFYIPVWNFSNLGDMRPGQGYYLKIETEEPIELVYSTGEEEELAMLPRCRSVYDFPGIIPLHTVTGVNMSVLVLRESPLDPPLIRGVNIPPLRSRGGTKGGVKATPPLRSRGGIKGGVEVGVYISGKLVGGGILQDGVCGIAVWGDDPSTDEVDGAVEGDRLEIRLLDGNGLQAVEYEVLAGEMVYQTDGLLVIRLTDAVEVPEDFTIISAYPNPFNSRMHVRYSLPDAARVEMNVYDLSGRHVAELVNGHRTAGFHTSVFDGAGLASGVYIVRFDAGGHTSQMKVVLVK